MDSTVLKASKGGHDGGCHSFHRSEDWIRSAEVSRSARVWVTLQTGTHGFPKRRFQRTLELGTFPTVPYAVQEEKEKETDS